MTDTADPALAGKRVTMTADAAADVFYLALCATDERLDPNQIDAMTALADKLDWQTETVPGTYTRSLREALARGRRG